MNLLIHQDYGDHSRKAVIQFFIDGIQLWNPGDSFSGDEHLLDPGEKEVRNPSIAMALRRIDMCEQAGTGLRMMRREWQALGHAVPTHHNDRARKAFELFLPDEMSRVVQTAGGEIADLLTPQSPPQSPPQSQPCWNYSPTWVNWVMPRSANICGSRIEHMCASTTSSQRSRKL
ncbi:MAG: hypothetical protein FWG52_08060 [Proteobacteria bacterium]|nr:hypothetical protein [Pseudomonadota bacterium]